MDPMINLVRQRTDDLRRVADNVRRERDLRAATGTAAAQPSDRLSTPAVRVATRVAVDGDGRCPPAGQTA